MKTYRILCLSTALSPLTHMAGTEGNEAILNRQPIMTLTGRRFIPLLSGNALRHRVVREPLARHLIETCGLAGTLSRRAANFFLHGGSLSESTARVDLSAKLEMKQRLPFVRMLGGALPGAIEEGSLRADQGVLVCRENADRVAAMSGWEVPGNLRPAEDFVGSWQYTRSDARNTAAEVMQKDGDAGDSNLMIYSGQQVIPGAVFVHGFILEHASELEVGALLLGISLWQQAGSTIGGSSSKGHGRLETRIRLPEDLDGAKCIAEYLAHVAANAEWLRDWVGQTFAAGGTTAAAATGEANQPAGKAKSVKAAAAKVAVEKSGKSSRGKKQELAHAGAESDG